MLLFVKRQMQPKGRNTPSPLLVKAHDRSAKQRSTEISRLDKAVPFPALTGTRSRSQKRYWWKIIKQAGIPCLDIALIG